MCWAGLNITKRTKVFLNVLHQEMSVFVGKITSNVSMLFVVAVVSVKLQLWNFI